MSFLSSIFNGSPKAVPFRPLHAGFILNPGLRAQYEESGYTVLKGAATHASLDHLRTAYSAICALPEFTPTGNFQTTQASGNRAHAMGVAAVNHIAPHIFSHWIDESIMDYSLGGSLLIKNKGSFLGPHQGSPLIDEYKGVTTFAWIPLESVDKDNGIFHVLEKSHRWAAWQRTGRHNEWPLQQFEKVLWKYMTPVPVNKGDVLLFDSALIHASAENTSGRPRIAANLCLVERSAVFVQYALRKSTPKGKIEKHFVDRGYWLKGEFSGPPSGYNFLLEETIYPPRVSPQFLKKISGIN